MPLVCFSTESTTDIKDISVNLYQVHALCYCKHVHHLLSEIKFEKKLRSEFHYFLIVLERNSGMDVVTDKTFLICMHFTNEVYRSF